MLYTVIETKEIKEKYQTKEEILDEAIRRFNHGRESKDAITIPESLMNPTAKKGEMMTEEENARFLGVNSLRSQLLKPE